MFYNVPRLYFRIWGDKQGPKTQQSRRVLSEPFSIELDYFFENIRWRSFFLSHFYSGVAAMWTTFNCIAK
jgi:hypothetical protein